MIFLDKVSLRYKDETALDSISLEIEKGSFVCILGASGSGKTSILSLISGIRQATTGSVLIEGEKIESVREKTALISQNYGLLPWKTVFENIAFTLRIRKVANYRECVVMQLKNLGLEAYQNRYPHQLSGGQQQRVAIGRALALDTDLLLMDEAFSALDSMAKESLQSQVLDLNRSRNLTMVFVSHNIEEAVFLASRIVIMEQGTIKADYINPAQGLREGALYYDMCSQVRHILHD